MKLALKFVELTIPTMATGRLSGDQECSSGEETQARQGSIVWAALMVRKARETVRSSKNRRITLGFNSCDHAARPTQKVNRQAQIS
jgi:hypothetical protein